MSPLPNTSHNLSTSTDHDGNKEVMGDPNRFHLLGDWAVTNVRKKWGSTERVLGAMGVSQTRGRNGSQGRCWV